MRSHPVTPMMESDLIVHLSRQTRKKIGLIDLLALERPDVEEAFAAALGEGCEVILFDVFDEPSLAQIGRILWSRRPPGTSFVVGSSGVEYALIEHWRAMGQLPPQPQFETPRPAERVVIVSGSCSLSTEKQIRWAVDRGFAGIPVDAQRLVSGDNGTNARAMLLNQALENLAQGRSIILYTALGSEDSERARAAAESESVFGLMLGEELGVLLREIILRSGVRRFLVAGGDTSSTVGGQLRMEALTMASPLIPGAPLCRTHSSVPDLDGLEVVFKGGQVGPEDCFERLQDGRAC